MNSLTRRSTGPRVESPQVVLWAEILWFSPRLPQMMTRMRLSLLHRTMPVATVVLLASLVFVSACSSGPKANTTSTSVSTSTTAPAKATGQKVALGTNNPAQGDCTTKTSESASSVGFVVLNVTANSFQAEIQLQKGPANATYGVFMQQVPGSCPQQVANGGMLTTDSTGHGDVSTTVARVSGATTFYVQLVPGAAGAPTYTSDRISAAP